MKARPTNRVLVNSMPKSGTHLLMKVVDLCGYQEAVSKRNFWQRAVGTPRKLSHEGVKENWIRRILSWLPINYQSDTVPIGVGSPVQVPVNLLLRWLRTVQEGHYIVGHLPWSPLSNEIIRQLKYKHVLIVRDPRDVLVSFLYYVQKPAHDLSIGFSSLDKDAQVALVVNGGYVPASRRQHLGMGVALRSVLDWSRSDSVLIVRFEDLIGERGGGSRELQHFTVGRICSYLDINSDGESVTAICSHAFDTTSPTFRQGRIGAWKNELTSKQLKLFEQSCGHLLDELGYSS